MAHRISKTVGRALRQARRGRSFTLRDVQIRSRARFKASAVGGYERGERDISLGRFCELAWLYGVSPGRLLSDALQLMSRGSTRKVVIDLARLSQVKGEEGRLVAQFVHDLKAQRGDYIAEVITLRSGDLEILATQAGAQPRSLLDTLKPALRETD